MINKCVLFQTKNKQTNKQLKLIGESEEQLAPTLSKNQKRKQRRIGNKARWEGLKGDNRREGEEGGDSFLMIEGGGRVETEM